MRKVLRTALVFAGVATAASAVRRWVSSCGAAGDHRWQAVTVNCGPDHVIPGGRLPEPLSRLGMRVEVQLRPAADAKGTEILARSREVTSPVGQKRVGDPHLRHKIWLALRETKSLVEADECHPDDRRRPNPCSR